MIPKSVAKARPRLHCVGPASAAYAAHAEGVARIRSTPSVFSSDVEGSTISGAESVTFNVAGKAIDGSGSTVEFADVPLMHWAALISASARVATIHVPAVVAEVVFEAQHAQALQPAVVSAEDAQQQPPMHKFIWQSKLEEHASPG